MRSTYLLHMANYQHPPKDLRPVWFVYGNVRLSEEQGRGVKVFIH